MLILGYSLAMTGCNNSQGDGEYQPYENLVGKNSEDGKTKLENPLSDKKKRSEPLTVNKTNNGTDNEPLIAPLPKDKILVNKTETTVPANRVATGTSTPSFAELLISAAIGHTASSVAAEETGETVAWIASAPREVKILIPEKDFRVEGPEDSIRVSYDDINLLKVMNMEPVTAKAPDMMPDWLKNLDGKRIRIRGFMSPTFRAKDLDSFLLGRDNQACCFPGRAKIYDLFPVKMRVGKTVDFIDNRPFDVWERYRH